MTTSAPIIGIFVRADVVIGPYELYHKPQFEFSGKRKIPVVKRCGICYNAIIYKYTCIEMEMTA